MRINESIICGWGNGEELGMTAVVLVDVASDSFLTSMDYLYTEGKVAMERCSVTSINWVPFFGFCCAMQSIMIFVA